MCFNMSIVTEMQRLEHDFNAVFEQLDTEALFTDGKIEVYNASAFTHPVWPILTVGRPGFFSRANWGLVPSWVRDRKKAIELRRMTLNARSETIWERPSFRTAASAFRRCIIPVDGFFEPFHHEKKSYPFFIHRQGELFGLGGLYDLWRGPESGEEYVGFSVLTRASRGIVDTIHHAKHRMPLIIPESMYSRWLDDRLAREEVEQIISDGEYTQLKAHPVSMELYRGVEAAYSPGIREVVEYGIEAVDNLVTL
jgi:putative SOS response-associated peptidase YedK